MSSRRSSSLLDKGPMDPKQKSDRTPPDANRMPRYKMASLFDQPKLSLAMGVTSLKRHERLARKCQLTNFYSTSHVSIKTKVTKKLKKHQTDMEQASKSGLGAGNGLSNWFLFFSSSVFLSTA